MGGTGKSQVLKALSFFFQARNESHQFTTVAPTGNAAALLGGSTYHYLFGINEYTKMSNMSQIKSRLEGVEYVFLDEVSMLSARDMYKISHQLSCVLNIYDKPFGGMNMVFAGDFAQLPPAIGGETFHSMVNLLEQELQTRRINWKGIMAPSNHSCNSMSKYASAKAK